MSRSTLNSGFNAISLGFAIIAGITSISILIYGILNAEWVLVGFSFLGFLYIGKVYQLYRATSRLPGTINDQIHRDVAQDVRFHHRPIVHAERALIRFNKRISLWGPVVVAGVFLLIWGSIPLVKMVLVYIPPLIGKLTGTM